MRERRQKELEEKQRHEALVCIMIHILSYMYNINTILCTHAIYMYMYTTHAINVTNRNIYTYIHA